MMSHQEAPELLSILLSVSTTCCRRSLRVSRNSGGVFEIKLPRLASVGDVRWDR